MMNQYQVTFNADGTIDSTHVLPAEPEKKRVILVRETSLAKAQKAAKTLYSLAK